MFTQYAIDYISNLLLAGGAAAHPATLYFAGFKTAPTRTTGGVESSYTNYAREAITAGTSSFSAASGTSTVSLSNSNAIVWPQAGVGTSETWTAIGMLDAATLGTGNLWAYWPIPVGDQVLLTQNSVPQEAAGEIVSEFALSTSGGLTTFAAGAILNWLFRHTSLGVPASWHLGSYTTNPTIAGGGSESAANQRVTIAANSTNWGSASGTNPITQSNLLAATFAALAGITSETWVGWSLLDSATVGAGNMWIFGLLATAAQLIVGPGNVPQYPAGTLEMIWTGTT